MKNIVTTYVYKCGCSFSDNQKPFSKKDCNGQISCPKHPKARLYYRERKCKICRTLIVLNRQQTRKIYCDECRVIMKKITTKRYQDNLSRTGARPCSGAQTEVEKPWWETEQERVLNIITKVGDKFNTPPIMETPVINSIIARANMGEL